MLAKLVRRNCQLFSRSFYSEHLLDTPINRNEDTLVKNKNMMDQVNGNYKNILEKVLNLLNQVTTQRDPKVLNKLSKAGKLPVRERIEKLLDPGSPFL